MPRNPSFQGTDSTPQAITKTDGTWPLPEGMVRELAPEAPAPLLSGRVPALRQPTASLRPSTKAPAFPRPPRPPRPANLPLALHTTWWELLDRHDALQHQDHFEALGVGYEAGGSEVQAAFSQLITRVHPDKLPNELELLRPYAVRIVARLNVARMALAARRDRDAYLRSIGRPVPPPSVAPSAAPGRMVARVRPERREVRRPGVVTGPVRAEPVVRSKRVSEPPSASSTGARLLRALRRERPPSD